MIYFNPIITSGAAAGIVEGSSGGNNARVNTGERYIKFPCFRLIVVLWRFWHAILYKQKLVEFRSSKQSIRYEPGMHLLFALGAKHRRRGKTALIMARVLKIGTLDVATARELFPVEAEQADLTGLAAEWGVTSVHCIVLDKDSI